MTINFWERIFRLNMGEGTRYFTTQRINGKCQNQHVNYLPLCVAKLAVENEQLRKICDC